MTRKKSDSAGSGVRAVAQAVGVSKSTVSRAFNSPELVKEEVRQKIFEIAAEMNYRPHPAARALRSQRTHIVGAAIPTLDYAIFARMVNEFEKTLSTLGASTIVITTGFDNRDVFDDVRQLVDRGAEALLLVGEVEDPKLKDFVRHASLPVVTTYSAPPDSTVPAVGFDNYRAFAEAVEHLAKLGHKSYAMIASMTDGNDRQRARIAAYRDTLERHGLIGSDRVYKHTYEMRSGVSTMEQILDEYPETTAVICNSDVFAIGALKACRNRGVRVPEDISIIGCDDFDFAELLDPPLTTIAVPAARMGQLAAETLWAAITQKKPVEGHLIETRIAMRNSIGPAPNARIQVST
ncbi:LacI family DNA-binding transcriptional regulator [Leisingera thetidis]|uniref:LacI family DNA-binding transcriptional regulator n=1 Tax=Leisingera thetidis TaxID=2930199 RepID=UPI0021F76C9A|nr:substrate-binding domain-containing protein [Leisingera thetidis]